MGIEEGEGYGNYTSVELILGVVDVFCLQESLQVRVRYLKEYTNSFVGL